MAQETTQAAIRGAPAAGDAPRAMWGNMGGRFSPKAFIQGLLAGCVLLVLLMAWLWLHGSATEIARQARLPFALAAVDMTGANSGIALSPLQSGERQTAPSDAMPASDTTADKAESASPSPSPSATSAQPPEAIALAPAPIAGLYETTPSGKLPVINKDTGQTPFQVYRRPFDMTHVDGKPVISLIVTNGGLSQAATDAAFAAFPPQVSMAVSPYAEAPDAIVNAMRAKGHEVWMVLPMHNPSYPRVDPGPYTLLKGVPKADNLKKLTDVMAHTIGYAGLIGTRDADFTASSADAQPILDEIYKRGLGFIDPSNTTPADPSHPDVKADVWFARSASKSDIDDALKRLEDTARKNGHAIGVIPPLPLIYPAVRDWIAGLAKKGFVLAPVSAQAAQEDASAAPPSTSPPDQKATP